jgi:hypothetical protein
MKAKAIEKYQEELIVNTSICFNCNIIEGKDTEDKTNIFSCLKCSRAHYCSFKCMKKMKTKHDPICMKYSEKFSEVNDIIENYIK